MARIKGERWSIRGKPLRVYDEAECPICASIKEVRELGSFHQHSLLLTVIGEISWSHLKCERCQCEYMYRVQYDIEITRE